MSFLRAVLAPPLSPAFSQASASSRRAAVLSGSHIRISSYCAFGSSSAPRWRAGSQGMRWRGRSHRGSLRCCCCRSFSPPGRRCSGWSAPCSSGHWHPLPRDGLKRPGKRRTGHRSSPFCIGVDQDAIGGGVGCVQRERFLGGLRRAVVIARCIGLLSPLQCPGELCALTVRQDRDSDCRGRDDGKNEENQQNRRPVRFSTHNFQTPPNALHLTFREDLPYDSTFVR